MKEAVVPESSCVHVGSGDQYPVLIGEGLLAEVPRLLKSRLDTHRFVIITDDNVAPLHSAELAERCRDASLDAMLLTFPSGEVSKTRKSWSILTDEMLDAGLGRDTCVVAVGGGVTTDLAGFVAATFMRGLPLVQVPTSYLAMVDASIGGKTGVDLRQGKNLVGAFHRPEMVVIDPVVLGTLPDVERAQGLVEAFKHGAILDGPYFDSLRARLSDLLAADPDAARGAVLRSVELKAAVVTEDELENGYRQILNFGHTIGHALEAASDFTLGHGSAVALGMVVEARLGEAMGVTATGAAARLEDAMTALLGELPGGIAPDAVVRYLSADKKTRRGRARYVLLRDIGKADPGDAWTHEAPDELVIEVLTGLYYRP